MQQQVITIDTNGVVSGLQRKPGQGLDLRQLGPCEIKRASEIVWDDTAQRWFIRLCEGVSGSALSILAGVEVTSAMIGQAGLHLESLPGNPQVSETGTLFFHEYDDAVKAEIAYLDAWRLKGKF